MPASVKFVGSICGTWGRCWCVHSLARKEAVCLQKKPFSDVANTHVHSPCWKDTPKAGTAHCTHVITFCVLILFDFITGAIIHMHTHLFNLAIGEYRRPVRRAEASISATPIP